MIKKEGPSRPNRQTNADDRNGVPMLCQERQASHAGRADESNALRIVEAQGKRTTERAGLRMKAQGRILMRQSCRQVAHWVHQAVTLKHSLEDLRKGLSHSPTPAEKLHQERLPGREPVTYHEQSGSPQQQETQYKTSSRSAQNATASRNNVVHHNVVQEVLDKSRRWRRPSPAGRPSFLLYLLRNRHDMEGLHLDGAGGPPQRHLTRTGELKVNG